MTLVVLTDKGASNAEITKRLGGTEGTVRHHRTRHVGGQQRLSNAKIYKAEALAKVIEHWMADRSAFPAALSSGLRILESHAAHTCAVRDEQPAQGQAGSIADETTQEADGTDEQRKGFVDTARQPDAHETSFRREETGVRRLPPCSDHRKNSVYMMVDTG